MYVRKKEMCFRGMWLIFKIYGNQFRKGVIWSDREGMDIIAGGIPLYRVIWFYQLKIYESMRVKLR